MSIRSKAGVGLAIGCALLGPAASSQQPEKPAALAASGAPRGAPKFSAPVRLKAGEKFMGEKRLYPSPVFHDVNGDGLADVVIGDLPGILTVALRVKGSGPPTYAAETRIKGRDGKDLDFSNW